MPAAASALEPPGHPGQTADGSALEAPGHPEQTSERVLLTLERVGDHGAERAAELEAVPAAAAGDQDPVRPRRPVDQEVPVGRVLVQAGPTADQSSPCQT